MYNNFKRSRIIKTIKEVESLTKNINKYGLKVIKIGIGTTYKSISQYLACEKENTINLNNHIVFDLKDTKLEITTMYGPELCKPCTYVFHLNGEDSFVCSGLQCFAELNKYIKIPRASEYNHPELKRFFDDATGKYVCSARPTLGYNKDYEGIELLNCYEYDINSAYTSTMQKSIPDLLNPIFNERAKKGQVGFLLDDELTMMYGPTKSRVDVVFNLIPTPQGLIDFNKKWYNIKKNAQGEERLRAKAYLNLPIGYSQRYNPFFRAYVVHTCNKVIYDLVKEYKDCCLLWNTDAIYTTRKLDLDIGPGIGQFKEIPCCKICYIGNTYQIDDEVPVYRGIPKEWFRAFEARNGRKYNLLQDGVPQRCNIYVWDWDSLKLRKRGFDNE